MMSDESQVAKFFINNAILTNVEYEVAEPRLQFDSRTMRDNFFCPCPFKNYIKFY